MAATLTRFVPKEARAKRETATAVADLLRSFSDDDLPPAARMQLLNALYRVSHPSDEQAIWPGGFTMISRQQTQLVWDAIRALPPEKRQHQVRHAFDLVLLNLRHDTGEVMLTREQFSEQMETSGDNVSRVMTTLEEIGVIRRERRRVEGMRGPGMVVYFINPHVGWTGSLNARKEAAKNENPPPLLTLMEGGKTA